MPGMDGTEACSIMREQGFKGKIIGVTGDVQAEDINNFKCHGADIVLPKPIDIRTLHDYISGTDPALIFFPIFGSLSSSSVGVFVCFKD